MTNRQNLTNRPLLWLGGLFATAAAIAGIASAANRTTAPEEPARVVQVIPVDSIAIEPVTEFDDVKTYTGTIEAARASELSFEREGKIIQIDAEEGDEIYQGKVLAQLDLRHLKARQEELTAQRDQAVALLEEYKAGPRKETIAAAKADVADLNSQYEYAKSTHERNQDLRQKKVIAKEEFDRSAYSLLSAKARKESAQKKLDELLAGTRKEQIAAQQAVVAQLDAALENLQIDLSDASLTAPFNGRISARHVDEGTVVSPNTPVLRLVETGNLEARIGIPVDLARKVKRGEKHEVLVGEQAYPATVKAVLPELDLATRTRTVVLKLDPEDSKSLVPGEVVRLTVTETEPTQGFWLPTASLSRGRRGLWSVLVIGARKDSTNQIAERRDVETLHTRGEEVLVRGTLQAGDRVITGGTHRIVAGQPVVDSRTEPSANQPLSKD